MSSAEVPRRRMSIAAVLALALLGTVIAPQAARADEVSDKKAQAQVIAAKIEALDRQIEQFAEAANGAQVRLDDLNAQVGESQGRVAVTRAQADQHRGEVRAYAVRAYVQGGDPTGQDDLGVGNDGTVVPRQSYLSSLAGNRNQLIDQLRASEHELTNRVAELETSRTEARNTAQDLQARRASAQTAVDEQTRLYDQAQGELASLVAEAQREKAAEEQAAAEARVQQVQRTRPAPPQAAPRTSPAVTPGVAPAPSPAPVPGGASGPAPATRSGVDAVIAEAKRQLGKPYVWGAAGPDSFDCSGFTMWSWRAGGVNLPHYTVAQYNATRHIPMDEIQPGDLIFYGADLGHNAIYLGGGQIIHAPNSRSVVRIDSLYYWNVPMVASRP